MQIWIGRLKDNDKTVETIITKNLDGKYDVAQYYVYSDGSRGKDLLRGWACSLSAAKRRATQDTDWKSKDFAWEIHII